MPHLTSTVILSWNWILHVTVPPAKAMSPSHPPCDTNTLAMSESQEESPRIQTVTGKDLGNQLATAGEATEDINLSSSNIEKGICFVFN